MQMKDLSTVFNKSLNYWKDTLDNLGKNFCDCSRNSIVNETDNMPETLNNFEVSDNPSNLNINIDENVKIENNDEMYIDSSYKTNSSKFDNNLYNANNNSTNYNRENNLKRINTFNYDKRAWSQEEDTMLLELVNTSKKKNWKRFSEVLKTKNPQQCSYRFEKVLKNQNISKWTRNDDFKLLELIDFHGQNWEKISLDLNKPIKEVKDRFERKLDPNLKRSKFEKDEDALILQLFEIYGNKWDLIAKSFKDRSSSMIRNRYYSFLKKHKNGITSTSKNISEDISVSETKSFVSNNLLSKIDSFEKNFTEMENILKNSKFEQEPKNEIAIKIDNKPKILDSQNNNNFLEFKISEENYFNDNNNLINMKFEDAEAKNIFNFENIKESELLFDIKEKEEELYHNKNNKAYPNLLKMDTDSPNEEELKKKNNFNEQYKIAFCSKKNSFETVTDGKDITTNDKNLKNDNQNFDNEHLFKQYQMLEDIFEKVKEVSNTNMIDLNNNDLHTIRNLDEKRDKLTEKLKRIKSDYLIYVESQSIQNNQVRDFLNMQIETLIELINTTKTKINLMSSSCDRSYTVCIDDTH